MQRLTPRPGTGHRPRIMMLVVFCVLCIHLYNLRAQPVFTWNALADVEVSKAGEKSHYYYNEIDKDNLDWRFGMSRFDLSGQLALDSNWTFNARALVERDKGLEFSRFIVPQANIQWVSGNRKMGITLGLFTNPFGSFNQKQLSTQRTFIGRPLAYSYYTNISSRIGYMPAMGDVTKIPIDGVVQWGSSTLYYGGYTAGAMLSWNIKPAKVNWKLALVNGASNQLEQFTDPWNWGIVSRLGLQPTYYWEQGISVSHGSFMEDSEVSDQLAGMGMYTQTLIGTDFKIGSGFFEFSGELIGAYYRVPQFDSETGAFETGSINDPLRVRSFSAYLDIKYEFPMLQGSYIAYRIDHLGFNKPESASQRWDNNALRHSFALGYHINRFVLARVAVSTQQVDDKPWDKTQRTFRFVLTAHY